MLRLAWASLLRRKYCVNGTVGTLKKQFKVTDHEIAEVMMVASVAAAGTKLRKSWMGICLVAVKRAQRRAAIARAQPLSLVKDPKFTRGVAIRPLGEKYDETEGRRLD